MGTTGVYMTADDTRAMLLRDFEYVNQRGFSHVLASAKGAGGFWILREVEYNFNGESFPKHVTATFIKMSSSNGMTYYKEIDVDCGPAYYSCPSSWLNRIQPQSKYGVEWLETAKAHQMNLVKVTVGTQVTINGDIYTAIEYKGNGKWWVRNESNQRLYQSTSKQIRDILSRTAKKAELVVDAN
jgi:hypothetical protein